MTRPSHSTGTFPIGTCFLIASSLSAALGCGGETTEPPDGAECGALAEVEVRCDGSTCRTETGTRTFAEADLDPGRYVIVSWATSEFIDTETPGNESVDVQYGRQSPGALRRAAAARRRRAPSRAVLDHLSVGPRLRAEQVVRSWQSTAPFVLPDRWGRAPLGSRFPVPGPAWQQAACSRAAPECDGLAVCALESDAPDAVGVCESSLRLKFRTGATSFDEVTAEVKWRGRHAAIVVETGDEVSAQVLETLGTRFDEHIAPLSHALFGPPTDASGADRDGNGLVLFFFSHRVPELVDGLVGFFQPDDMRDPETIAPSNGRDLLYLAPPSADISVDSIAGTIAHEYEHLQNFASKVVRNGSSPESVWLDEGLATLAEDLTGHGSDAQENLAAYLACHSNTSLTGASVCTGDEVSADTAQRRGMVFLFLRYLFEQAGGADFGTAPGIVEDRGGVARIRGLVDSGDTGIDLFSDGEDAFHRRLGEFLGAVAASNADYPDVSCHPSLSFAAPETDAVTGQTRGVVLRGSVALSGGRSLSLSGPTPVVDFRDESAPLPVNGGEVRHLSSSQASTVRIGGPGEDFRISFRIFRTGSTP